MASKGGALVYSCSGVTWSCDPACNVPLTYDSTLHHSYSSDTGMFLPVGAVLSCDLFVCCCKSKRAYGP